ncbi:bifunctional adenosylcobinamide kinase/adenosylcobinamide-phosphate guanylyltransferase [Enterococcus sp. 669A]|uniref:Adenosylcobinamide kinase n=1 Tax=Candidatus Enterococcus moelleringii TaxID=2815325 RepID=A0ABS3LED9_9ENTE|nr:bifunctional adenosylcobinamide kinase/adenosylcobinamide-phosphate guanylyltransferase [Enterococcus sp. 669A]MBO1307990.1 bifunctional adenosylcobinamide kinase/adenosylcobinamide-phosphate guanylyltransferase [Enterococcus sp. 669A]
MGQITLITGGARSGKSNFAESFFWDYEPVCYIATNGAARDEETKRRVELHQERRANAWSTHEAYLDLAEFIAAASSKSYLLDCATMLTTNYFYHLMQQQFGENYQLIDEQIANFSEQEKSAVEAEILTEWQKIIAAAKENAVELVIVTNEVGLGIVPEDPFVRWFRDVFGRINQFLGKEADVAFLVVAGIPVKLK